MPEVVYRSTHPDVLAYRDKQPELFKEWRSKVEQTLTDLGFPANSDIVLNGQAFTGVVIEAGAPLPDGWRRNRDHREWIHPAKRTAAGRKIAAPLHPLRGRWPRLLHLCGCGFRPHRPPHPRGSRSMTTPYVHEPHPDRPTIDRYGKLRPAKSVQPGWHVWTTDGWFEVQIFMHTENVITGQKFVRFYFADGTDMATLKTADVMCRTAAEAKRAARSESEASA